MTESNQSTPIHSHMKAKGIREKRSEREDGKTQRSVQTQYICSTWLWSDKTIVADGMSEFVILFVLAFACKIAYWKHLDYLNGSNFSFSLLSTLLPISK